jgi:RNA polymerase sigma-70 factor (ECF subfamily)
MGTSKKTESQDMKHLDDQELMRRVQSGDFSPVSEIYDRYAPRLYNFAYRFLRNSEGAEDAVQETFMRLMKNAKQFNRDAKLGTWLFAITANWCRDFLRKADNRPKESDEVLVGLPASHEYSPHRRLEAREVERRLERALSRLEPEAREVILLFKFQGFSHAEIAQVAGCSEGAVKLRVFRAMKALKEVLAPAGDASGGDECLNVMS